MAAGLLDQARRGWAAYLSDLWHSGGWDDQPEDERDYSQRHLAAHLDDAGVPDAELHALIDERWLRAWWAHEGTYEGFLADVDRAWRRAERARDLVAQITCALCTAGGAALSANASPELLAAAVTHGVLAPEQALGLVRRAAQSERAPRLIALAPHLPARSIDQALDIAESLTVVYAHIPNRNDVLAALAPHMPPLLHARAVELASSISSDDRRARAVVGLAPHVADEHVAPLLAAASGIANAAARATALSAVLARVGGADHQAAAREAYAAVRSVADDEARADALTALLGTVRGPLARSVWRSALTAARHISRSRIASFDARDDAGLRAEKLVGLLPHATRPARRTAVAREALAAIARVDSGNRSWLLRDVMPQVPVGLRSHARRVVLSSDDHSLSDALDTVASDLTPRQWRAAVGRAGNVRPLRLRVEGLLVLARHAAGPSRRRVADAIVALLRRLEESHRARVLVDVAPLVRPAALGRLLHIAGRIRDADDRARALSGIAPLLPAALAERAIADGWNAANQGKDDGRRLDMLTSVLPLAQGRLRARLERSRSSLVKAVGSRCLDSDRIYSHARMLVTLDRVEDAFEAIAAVRNGTARSEAFTSLASRLPAEHQVRAVRAALDAARESEDEAPMAAFMAATEPHVDLDDLSCTEQMKARAGFYASNEDEDEEVDDAGDLAGPGLQLEAVLDAALLVTHDDSRREALAGMLKRLAPQHWPRAFDIADSIDDADERAEAWIAIAVQAPEPHRRVAQARALEAIGLADNEDDHHEPLLRLAVAEDFPPELFPRVLEVAADLRQHQDDERRARALTGLAQDFGLWVKRDREAAHRGWSDALRRMAARPRPKLLHDLAGFHHLGRLLVGPRSEARYVVSLRDVVERVCAWR